MNNETSSLRCNGVSLETSGDGFNLPAWATGQKTLAAEPEPEPADTYAAEERAAIQAEPPLDTAGLEPVRFEPGERAQPIEGFDDWIERAGADGRLGFDRPGQPVASRWWERTSFGDLPAFGRPLYVKKPKPGDFTPGPDAPIEDGESE